jgi:hypothetical protein
MDLSQMLNVSLGDQPNQKQRLPEMEDNIKISKEEYFCHLLLDISLFLN